MNEVCLVGICEYGFSGWEGRMRVIAVGCERRRVDFWRGAVTCSRPANEACVLFSRLCLAQPRVDLPLGGCWYRVTIGLRAYCVGGGQCEKGFLSWWRGPVTGP
jgi:hypothetical protein